MVLNIMSGIGLTAFLYVVLAAVVGWVVIKSILQGEKGFAAVFVALVIFYFLYGFITCPI